MAEFDENDDAVLRITSDARQAAEALLAIEAAYQKTAAKIADLQEQAKQITIKMELEVDRVRQDMFARQLIRLNKTIEFMEHNMKRAGITADILSQDPKAQIAAAERYKGLLDSVAAHNSKLANEKSREDAERLREEDAARKASIKAEQDALDLIERENDRATRADVDRERARLDGIRAKKKAEEDFLDDEDRRNAEQSRNDAEKQKRRVNLREFDDDLQQAQYERELRRNEDLTRQDVINQGIRDNARTKSRIQEKRDLGEIKKKQDEMHRNAIRQIEQREQAQRRFITGAGFGIIASGLPGTQTLGTAAVSYGFGRASAALGAIAGAGIAGTIKAVLDISQKVKEVWTDITRAAFEANARWEQARISLAALLATNLSFSENLGQNFEIASGMAEELHRSIVLAAVDFSGTSEELSLAFNKFVSAGGLAFFKQDELNVGLDKSVKLTRLIAQAALLYTSGQNRGVQVQQEMNAILTRQVRVQDTISQRVFGTTKAQQEANFKILDQYIDQGRALEFFEERLSGVNSAAETLGKSQRGSAEAIKDWTDLILRSGTEDFFEKIKDTQIKIVQFMEENQGILSDLVSDFSRVNMQLLETAEHLLRVVTYSSSWEEVVQKVSIGFNLLEAIVISLEERVTALFRGFQNVYNLQPIQAIGNFSHAAGAGIGQSSFRDSVAINLAAVEQERIIDRLVDKQIKAGIEAKKLVSTVFQLADGIPRTAIMFAHINDKIAEGIKLQEQRTKVIKDLLRVQEEEGKAETDSQRKRLAVLQFENQLRQVKLDLARREMEIGLQIAKLDFGRGSGTSEELRIMREQIQLERELAQAKVDAATKQRMLRQQELKEVPGATPGTKEFYDREIERLEIQNKVKDAQLDEEKAIADLARTEIDGIMKIDALKKKLVQEEFGYRLERIRSEIAVEKAAWESLQKLKQASSVFTGERMNDLPDVIRDFLNANTTTRSVENGGSIGATEIVRPPLPMEAVNILVGTNLKQQAEEFETAINVMEAKLGRLRASLEKTNKSSEKMELSNEILEAEKEEGRLNEQLISTLLLLRSLSGTGTQAYDELTVAIERAVTRQVDLQVKSVSWAESLEASLGAVSEILGAFDSSLGKVGSSVGGIITSITKISELKDLKTGKAYGSIGAGLGGMFGSAQGFLTQGLPMIGTIASFATTIVSAITDMFKKAAREAAEKISTEVGKITKAVEKSGKISEALVELERQRAYAVATLSDKKKGGKEELDKLLPQIDDQIDGLKNKLKEITRTFEDDLLKLKVDEPIGKIIDDFQEMTRRIKEFVDANGDSAETFGKAWEFAGLSIAKMRGNINKEIEDELKAFNEGAEDDWGNLISLEMEAINEKAELEKDYFENKERRQKELANLQKEHAEQEKDDLKAIADLQKELLELNDKEKEDIKKILNEGIAERESTTQQDKAQRIADVQDTAAERRVEIEEELSRIREVAAERKIANDQAMADLIAEDAEEQLNYEKAISRIDKRLEREIAAHNARMAEFELQKQTIAELEKAEVQWLTNAQNAAVAYSSALNDLRIQREAAQQVLDNAGGDPFFRRMMEDLLAHIDREIAKQGTVYATDPVLPINVDGTTGRVTTISVGTIQINVPAMAEGVTPEVVAEVVKDTLDTLSNGSVPSYI